MSEHGFEANDYWNDSHLIVLHDIARDYDDAYNGVLNALKKFGLEILKMDNVSAMVAGGEESMLMGRLKLLQLSKSVMSTILLDSTKETYEIIERSFTNISATLKEIDKRLQMATGLPHTVLFGEGSTCLLYTSPSPRD